MNATFNLSDLSQANLSQWPRCMNPVEPPATNRIINYVAYCYVLPIVCAVGILGNIANLITLASGRLKAVSYMYLRGLGIADMLCMLFVLVFVMFELLQVTPYKHLLSSYNMQWYKVHLMLPLINWSVSAGILIVVALTLERYISISWPILFREWNSPKRAKCIIVAAYVVSLLLYVPMYWQMEVVLVCPNATVGQIGLSHNHSNASYIWRHNGSRMLLDFRRAYGNVSTEDAYREVDSALQIANAIARQSERWMGADNPRLINSKAYQAYKYTRETLLKLIPILALTFLNLRIIVAFKKVRKRRRRLNSNSHHTREQRSLLFLLAGIVILFFFCNIPAAMNMVFINEAIKKDKRYLIFRAVANILEITNHALNFYNFCLCSSDYRLTFFRKFPCVKRVQEAGGNIKRRVSNSVMRVQGSRQYSVASKTENSFITSSLKTNALAVNGNARGTAPLRRAISSDALLRMEPPFSMSDLRSRLRGGKQKDSNFENPSTTLSSATSYVGRWRQNRRRFYESAENFQRFDAIPEDTSTHQVHSTASANACCQNDEDDEFVLAPAAPRDEDKSSKVDLMTSVQTPTDNDCAILITVTSSTDLNQERDGQNADASQTEEDDDEEFDDAVFYSSTHDVYL